MLSKVVVLKCAFVVGILILGLGEIVHCKPSNEVLLEAKKVQFKFV